MRSDYRFWILAGSSALVFSTVDAQDPNYFRLPRAKPSLGEVQIGGKFLLGPNVSFSGMGTMPYLTPSQLQNPEDYQSDLGPGISLSYIDGFVAQDYDVVTNDAGEQFRRRTTDGKTGYFEYVAANQQQEIGGSNYLTYHTLAATGSNDSYEGDTGNGGGLEIAYRRYLSPKKRLGLDFAISFAGFESNLNQTVNSKIYGTNFYHKITGTLPKLPEDTNGNGVLDKEDTNGNGVLDDGEDLDNDGVLDTEDANGNGKLDPYTGNYTRDNDANDDGVADDPEALVDLLPTDPTTGQFDKDGTEMTDEEVASYNAYVEGDMRFRTTAATFRFGPAYSLPITKSFSMAFSAGVTSSYYTGRLSAIQYLVVPTIDALLPSALVQESRSEVIFGGYAEGSAALQVNERVNMFTGVQYQSSGGYQMQAGDSYQVNVDLSNQVYIKTGFGVAF